MWRVCGEGFPPPFWQLDCWRQSREAEGAQCGEMKAGIGGDGKSRGGGDASKDPWYLVTDLDQSEATGVVTLYRQRWWIETLFRDKKNRDWGLGLSAVKLKDYCRYERLFYIVALAFIFLTAHGAAAEDEGFDRGLKANTRKIRVLNLLRTGYHFLRQRGEHFDLALAALRRKVMLQEAPNWG